MVVMVGQQGITLIRREGFVPKSYQHHLCVPTSHLSDLLDTWLRSTAMSYEICQPPCLFTGCADSLAGCLFVYPLCLGQSRHPLFFSAFSLSRRAAESGSALSHKPSCADLFTRYICCKVMSRHAVLRHRAYCLKTWSVISGGGLTHELAVI